VFDIHKLKNIFRKAFIPVTIMLVPHSKSKPLNFRIPFIGILASIFLCFLGIVYFFSVSINTIEYYRMKEKLGYYSQQFSEMKSTILSLKEAEAEFTRLFSLGSKEKVLENMPTSDSGSIDMENLKKQINITNETVGEIRDYLHVQRSIYVSTPKGLPVKGHISSHYGERESPISSNREFHSGLDISADPGNPVRATADGIVSFSGWSGGNGNLVVLEHGHGFSTFYAHNRVNVVKVGQKVKRGEVISYVGSTGSSTGPHVHYEIWKNGRHVNPEDYIKGRV
jgi:murein DD-endopeptidase MepM/ murein hydrolase activator NlpD